MSIVLNPKDFSRVTETIDLWNCNSIANEFTIFLYHQSEICLGKVVAVVGGPGGGNTSHFHTAPPTAPVGSLSKSLQPSLNPVNKAVNNLLYQLSSFPLTPLSLPAPHFIFNSQATRELEKF